jgi:hypothetical protein
MKSFAGVRGRASGGCNSGSPKISFHLGEARFYDNFTNNT